MDKEYEAIREAGGRWMQRNTDFACNLEWEDFDEDAQEGFRMRFHNMLKEVEGGNLKVGVYEVESELPDFPICCEQCTQMENLTMNRMLKANYRKIREVRDGQDNWDY